MTKKNKSSIFVILMMVLSLAVCILGADIMSTYITIGTFSIGNSSVKQTSFDIYAISLSSFANKVEAEEISKTYKKQNAGGYVLNYENSYHILASAYTSENDAIKVKDKLLEISVESKIIKLDFDELIIEGNFSNLEKTNLVSTLACFKETYEKLYDLSVSLDTEVIKEIDATLTLSEIKSNITKIKSNFDSLFNDKLTSILLEIKVALNSTISSLDSTMKKDDTTIPYSSRIKYSYLEILDIYYTLIN